MIRALLATISLISFVPSPAQAQLPPPNGAGSKAVAVRGSCTVTADGKTSVHKDVTVAECMNKSGTWSADAAAPKARDHREANPSTGKEKRGGK